MRIWNRIPRAKTCDLRSDWSISKTLADKAATIFWPVLAACTTMHNYDTYHHPFISGTLNPNVLPSNSNTLIIMNKHHDTRTVISSHSPPTNSMILPHSYTPKTIQWISFSTTLHRLFRHFTRSPQRNYIFPPGRVAEVGRKPNGRARLFKDKIP